VKTRTGSQSAISLSVPVSFKYMICLLIHLNYDSSISNKHSSSVREILSLSATNEHHSPCSCSTAKLCSVCSRFTVSVVSLGETVYAIGGGVPLQNIRTVERYDCRTNRWAFIAPMNVGRTSASAAVLNGKVKPVEQQRLN
jgi:hypothetical protein